MLLLADMVRRGAITATEIDQDLGEHDVLPAKLK